MYVTFEKHGVTKQVKDGFSWTGFLFAPWTPAFRGEWAMFAGLMALCLVGIALTFGIGNLVMAIVYGCKANRYTARKLAENGWTARDRMPEAWGIAA